MAKLNITVDLDWIDEESNLDEAVKTAIVNGVVEKVQNQIAQKINDECNQKLNEQWKNIESTISDRLNKIMDAFFETPRDITDRYGDIVQKSVTVKDTLKKACDSFLTQPLDKDGKPAPLNSYSVAYKTRIDYIVAKSINVDMEYAIKKAVDEATKTLKQRVTEDVKKQISDKLGEVIGIDKILNNK